ncbi:MAG: ribokinase [Acidimicrobiia bacterium]|nr:MAG: ribokinase [Acidimicrobiia bacterium]
MTVTASSPKIAVVGSTMIDLIAYTSRIPGPGETLVGERFQMGFGGKGANQAVMARLLGAEVSMINCLGDDAYGDMTLENFASFGIDTTHVRQTSGSSGVAPIWVEPDGTNRIIVVPGANYDLTPTQAASAVRALREVSVVVGQLEIPQEVTTAGFGVARAMGAVTVLNPAPAGLLDRDLVAVSTWLIPNEIEFEVLSGRPPTDDDALVAFAGEKGVRLLVTLGEDGVALVSDAQEVIRIDATQRDAVDTTGAGDAFVGAFSFGIARGMDELDAIALGNACAGDSVTRAGTQISFPDAVRSSQILAELART